MIIPTVRHWMGGGKVEILGYGARVQGVPEGMDWSLRPFKKTGDANESPELAMALSEIARSVGVKKLYAPSPVNFNATLCEPADLKVEIGLGGGVKLFRGINASGCRVPKGTAFVISGADCPTWAMCHSRMDILLAGHGGLKELVDYEYVVNGTSREWNNVVRAAFCNKHWRDAQGFVDGTELQLASLCGISSENLVYSANDRMHGKNNKQLLDELNVQYNSVGFNALDLEDKESYSGHIDLHEMIRGGACENVIQGSPGIPSKNFMHDLVDTYGDLALDGRYAWHSNARSKKLNDGNQDKRNLMVVVHH